jgi:predicted nucleic acid-binding protein
MIIVSDTTPLHYLILIDEVDLLPKLFGEIIIPVMVLNELQTDKTPQKIRSFG